MATAPSTTGIEITASFPLSFLLFLWPPIFEVDGQETRGKWEQPTTLSVSPGSHHVRVYYKYYWFLPASPAELDVDVAAGGVRRIKYKARWFVFLPGKTEVS